MTQPRRTRPPRSAASSAASEPARPSPLCRPCTAYLCEDCRSTVEELQMLAENRGQALYRAERALEKAQQDAAQARRWAESLDQILKLGQHALILAWMRSLTPEQVLEKVQAEVKP